MPHEWKSPLGTEDKGMEFRNENRIVDLDLESYKRSHSKIRFLKDYVVWDEKRAKNGARAPRLLLVIMLSGIRQVFEPP